MQLNGNANAVDEADDNFRNAIEEAKMKAGFVSAQRLLGTGDAAGTYICVSYWDSYVALKASSRGSEYYSRFLGKFADEEAGPKGFRKSTKPGTDMITHEFEHLHYERPQSVVPHLQSDGFLSTTFQLAAIAFGVGVFAMPSVFARLGLLLGSCLLAVFALLSNFTMQLMLQVAATTGAGSYEEVLYQAFGPTGRLAALVGLALSLFTANCAHMQFVSSVFVEMQGPSGGIMATLVGSDKRVQRFAVMVIFGGMALPLCFKRKLSELRFVSLGVVVFCLVACAVLSAKSLVLIAEARQNTEVIWSLKDMGELLDTAPVIAFGFSSIAELFHVRAEMKNPAMLGRCAHAASVLVAGLYLLIGLVGTLAFASPGSNLLEDFPGSHLVSVIRLGIILMVTFLYPIINFPYCQAVDALIAGRFGTPSTFRWKLVSIVGFVGVLLVDTLVTALDAVFGLAGGLGLGLIAYMLPSAAGLAVAFQRRHEAPVRSLRSWAHIICMAVVFIIGVALTFGSTSWIIYGVVKGQ